MAARFWILGKMIWMNGERRVVEMLIVGWNGFKALKRAFGVQLAWHETRGDVVMGRKTLIDV